MMESNRSPHNERANNGFTDGVFEHVSSVGGADSEITSPADGSSEQDIREALAENFAPYRAQAAELTAALASASDPAEVAGHVGSGTQVNVIRTGDGNVIKLPLPYVEGETPFHPEETVEMMVSALVKGLGEPGLEQIVTYHDQEPMAIVNREVRGPTLRQITEEQKHAVPDDHYLRLLDTLEAMQVRGLSIEPSAPGNIIYDPTDGFTLIDYETDIEGGQTLQDKIVSLMYENMFMFGAPFEGDRRERPVPAYALRYRDVCAQRYGSEIVAAIHEVWRTDGFIVPDSGA